METEKTAEEWYQESKPAEWEEEWDRDWEPWFHKGGSKEWIYTKITQAKNEGVREETERVIKVLERKLKTQGQDWEERFARKFCVMIERSGYTDEEVEEIYKFIGKEIDSQKQELLKEVLEITDKGFDRVCDGTKRKIINNLII